MVRTTIEGIPEGLPVGSYWMELVEVQVEDGTLVQHFRFVGPKEVNEDGKDQEPGQASKDPGQNAQARHRPELLRKR